MSKKQRAAKAAATAAPAPKSRNSALVFIVCAVALMLLAGVAWVLTAAKGANGEAEAAALQRPRAASTGSPGAAVHIVEFLDPACSTCREFYPYVKRLMKDNPGNIRVSVRMLAFHPNSDVAVKALEAAKRGCWRDSVPSGPCRRSSDMSTGSCAGRSRRNSLRRSRRGSTPRSTCTPPRRSA